MRRKGAERFRAAVRAALSMEMLEARRLLAGTLTITAGGTYTGTWASTDPTKPAVVIDTTDPVIIENSTISSKGDLIVTGVDHTNVTIRNTKGTALNPNVSGQAPGRFFGDFNFDNVVIENNDLENTSGIHLLSYEGDGTASDTVRVDHNTAHNIDGRKSDGNGGWMTFNSRVSTTDGHRENGFVEAQFVQLDKVQHVPGIEISWNQVINDPGNSRVEDNISIYLSSGTATSPICICDNYIQGAYTINPTQGSYTSGTWQYDWSYSGGGIMLGDGLGATASADPAFVRAFDNQIVSTTNYGIALSAGHDLSAFDNRIISTGVTNGTAIAAQNTGLYIWDSYNAGPLRFYNNSAHDNAVGWFNVYGRNDWWAPVLSILADNTHWSGSITSDTEVAEFTRWQAKLDPAAAPGPQATLSGTIFADVNGDGVRDIGDGGAAGLRVFLDLNGDGVWQQDEPIDRTSATGHWQIAVAPGAYVARLQPEDGWRATKGVAATLKVAAVGATATRLFGMSTTTLVTGIIYMDANKNGALDSGEAGLGGWTVYDDANHNGVLDAGEISTVTSADGRYVLIGLPPGGHQIRVVPWANYLLTAPGSGYRSATLNAGQTLESRNFGEKRRPR